MMVLIPSPSNPGYHDHAYSSDQTFCASSAPKFNFAPETDGTAKRQQSAHTYPGLSPSWLREDHFDQQLVARNENPFILAFVGRRR